MRLLAGLTMAAVAGLGVPPVSADTFFVSTRGNDNGPGTAAAPWRTIQRAAHASGPGDTVVVRGGVYNERVILPTSGTASERIVLQRYPGETPILDGSGIALGDTQGLLQAVDRSYITIDGLEIRNSSNNGVTISNGSHIFLLNLIVHNVGESGIAFYNSATPSYNVIASNTVHDARRAGIQLYQNPGGFFLLERNSVHDWQGDGNWDGIGVNDTPYVIIRGNTVFNAGPHHGADYIDVGGDQTSATSLAHHLVIEGNIVYRGSGQATGVKANNRPRRVIIRKNVIHGLGFAFYEQPHAEVAIYHNTVVEAPNHAVQLWNQWQGGNFNWGGITFKNNIFAFSDNYLLQHAPMALDGSLANIRFDGNVYRFSFRGIHWNMPRGEDIYDAQLAGAAGQVEYDRWRAATGQEPRGGIRLESALDEIFVDPGARDFRLRVGSPAVDAGGPLTVTTRGGSGPVVPVVESFYFTDGYGLTGGDWISVGSSIARVTFVNESRNSLTVDRPITWSSRAPVSMRYVGHAPDAGAYEVGLSNSEPPSPANLRIIR